MRASSGSALVLGLAASVLVDTALSAHRRDELLQAVRIGIDPDRVELSLDLTPGIDVAGTVIAELDRDRDGSLSAGERAAAIERVLVAIALEVDGQPLSVTPLGSRFPELDAFRRGEGTIHLQLAARLPDLPNGAHRLSFQNDYRRELSVYLANALVPESHRVAVVAQHRDGDQRDLAIDYVLESPMSLRSVWFLSGFAGLAVLAVFFKHRSRLAPDCALQSH